MPREEKNENEREAQLDAIIAEYYRLTETGGKVNQEEFIQRNPDFASELGEFFSDAKLFNKPNQSGTAENLVGATIAFGTSQQIGQAAGSVIRYFGEYEILEELGAGGMGVVYKARQSKLKRIVALKMIRSGELANSIDLKRFESEAKAAAKLTHPGIVSVHEVGIHGGQHFYTMDYVEGGNLSQLNRTKPVAPKRAVMIVRKLAEAMHYAHLKGIVHRDLKPANVLLTADGEPKITDFGLAKRVHDEDESQSPTMTESGQILGTAGYMSPEQASGKSRLVGPSSDVYSLGAVLYALLTGRAPFVGETPSHTIIQVLQKAPISPRRINPHVHQDLETICLKCLEKETYKRYGSAQLLANDLANFEEGKPVKARPVHSIERGWRWCRRNPILTSLLAMTTLLLLTIPCVILLQVMSLVSGVQNARGSVLNDLISQSHRYPSFAVTPILSQRFKNAVDPHRKRNLAFALADYGILNADYLVSEIDAIAYLDTGNYIRALQANPTSAISALKSEALKCNDTPLWRRKAKLAIAALALGDADLANDVSAFENRPDPQLRTCFIDEFPRWNLDLKNLLAAVVNSDSPALRSSICLGVGQISVGRMSESDREAWQSLASQWFAEHADATTHSASGWLLRHWETPTPRIPGRHKTEAKRDWLLNSVGATMLRIRPQTIAISAVVPDPREKYRKQLMQFENVPSERVRPPIRMQRAIANFQTGNLESALEDLNYLLEDAPGEAFVSALQYRTLTLARLGRADDSRRSLARYLEQEVPASHRAYMSILVPVWLGDIPEASRELELAKQNVFRDYSMLYNVACAASLCAQATATKDRDVSRQFSSYAIDLLEGAVSRYYKNDSPLTRLLLQAHEDPDFAFIHGDTRFASILAKLEESRKKRLVHDEFWIGDREVTRGQFEEFMNDTSYDADEKPVDWKGVDRFVSPTVDHPAQGTSWYDAAMFCNWLSKREGLMPCYERSSVLEMSRDGLQTRFFGWREIPGRNGYRLPREAEWEYACRAGTTTSYSMGDDESLLVGYCQMYPSKRTTPTGDKMPNAWGLHDVHGNVSECCWDSYGETTGVQSGDYVSRSGAFGFAARSCSSGQRGTYDPHARRNFGGFRLAQSSSSGRSAGLPLHSTSTDARWTRSNHVGLLKSRTVSVPGLMAGASLTSVRHSMDGSLILVGSNDGFARILHLERNELIQIFRGHSRTVWAVAFSPDGRTAITGSEDKSLRFWDVVSGQELDRYTGESVFSCVQYSPDGKKVFATSVDGKVRAWTLSNDKLGDALEFGVAASALGLAISPEQNGFIVGSASGHVLLCDADTGEIQRALEGHTGTVQSIAVLNKGEQILTASHDSTLRLWDVSTGKTEKVYFCDLGMVNEVCVLPDGKRFVSCSADRTVRLWDIESRRLLAAGIAGVDCRGISISPDGRSCLIAGTDGALWVWELPEPKEYSAGSTDETFSLFRTADASQADFFKKMQISVSPRGVHIQYDRLTGASYCGIDWGPSDGLDFIVRSRLSDEGLNKFEAEILQRGYERTQVKTVATSRNLNIHIGLWKKSQIASESALNPDNHDLVTQGFKPNNAYGKKAAMMLDAAFQADFNQKILANLRPLDVYVSRDLTTGEPLYGVQWGQADGVDFIVRHGMSDENLKQNDADALQNGYKRRRVRTVIIHGKNHHIGLWLKPDVPSP